MDKRFVLIVGLGNPGDKYAHTRHNAGFEVMELLEKKFGVKPRKKMLQPWAEAEWTDGARKIILCRPLTYMNNSGVAVKKVCARYGIKPEDALIIYDDIDLAPGKALGRGKAPDGSRLSDRRGMRGGMGDVRD